MKRLISMLALLLVASYVHNARAKDTTREQREQSGAQQNIKRPVTRDEAIAIARKDAEDHVGDLTPYDVQIKEAKRECQVDFDLKKKGANGGPLHYRISKATGKIVWKQYEQ